MAELIRTNDVALISVIESLLIGAEIPYQVADRHMSVMDGMIPVIQQRVLVADDDLAEARELMTDAGLGEWA